MIEQYNQNQSYDPREKMPIFNPLGGACGVVPVTDKSERSATLMGDDYVKLSFVAEERVLFEAFSFIVYDDKHYFLREKYRPTPQGSYYQYEMTFVSSANMLSKSLFMRYYEVDGETIQPEPEVNINANLKDMAEIVKRSIIGASSRIPKFSNQTTVYAQMIGALQISEEDMIETSELKTFSFESSNIEEVLNDIAEQYETEWWISESNGVLKLHIRKCEEMVRNEQTQELVPASPVTISDTFQYVDGKAVPYISRGLLSCNYAQEWSNIPQRILPYGSDRNIVRDQALDNLNDKAVYVSYGKRLRLTKSTYTVKDKENNDVILPVGTYGEIENPSVTSGIEKTELFDDIYPQGHFIITKCEKSENGLYYTIEGQSLVSDANGKPIEIEGEYVKDSIQEMATPVGQTVVVDGVVKDGLGIVPLQNKNQTEDLTIRFESGWLKGREFGVSRNNGVTVTIDGVNYPKLSLDIVPDGNEDEALSLPNDAFYPKVGDLFAIFNMDMPEGYVTKAEQRLAQAAYEKLLEYQASRPDVKCKSEPKFFSGVNMLLGKRFSVYSELFGEVYYINDDPNAGIDESRSAVFTSRVTAYSYSLTMPESVDFTLASGRVAGRLAAMESMISDTSSELRGLEQRHINLSKRGWHDAEELSQMLESLTTEMMLVGNARYQFGYTFGIVLDPENVHNIVNRVAHTKTLKITGGGCLQHTQKPYIDYPNQGLWYVDETIIDLSAQSNGEYIYDPAKPYYVYAIVNNTGARLTNQDIVLLEDKRDGEDDTMYMLLGVLSSEFEDEVTGITEYDKTSFRIFSRTNGYTAITGGTITTEQIQDANRQLIIDFQSTPPRIIAKRGAQIIGNITFISSDGAETNLATKMNNVDEELAKEIGGENLYSGVDPLQIITSTKDTDIVLENGKKYVISVAAIDGDAWGLLAKEKIGSAYSDLGWIVENGTIGTMQHYDKKTLVVTGHGGKLALQVRSSGSDYYYTLTGIMVQQGEKPTTYHAGYLAKALERDATKEVTSIDGGLLLSALIKLAQGGVVRAGMSGLADYGQKTIDGQTYQSEGVGFWAGSDYVDALNAACGIETNTLPPVFLSKTGYKSRIGCFRVVDKDTIAVVTGESTIYITNKNIDDVTVMQDSDSEYMDATIRVDDGDPSQSGSGSVVSSVTFNVAKSGKYAIYVPQTEIDAVSRVLSYPAAPGVYPGQTDSGYASAVAYGSFYIRIKNNGVIIHSSSSKTVNTENQTDDGASKWWEDTDSATIPSINLTKEITAGSLVVEIVGSYSVSASADENTSVHASGDARGEILFSIGDVVITGVEKYCVVAKDGMAIISNSNAAFYVRNSGTQLNVVAKGLPNRTNAIPGGLYVSNENVCVKPL